MEVENASTTFRMRQLSRTSPSPVYAVCRGADVVDHARQRRAAASRDIERQAEEITRLVKLAELCAARRQQVPAGAAAASTTTTSGPVRAPADDERRRRTTATSARDDASRQVPVTATKPAVSAGATSDGRRGRGGAPSPRTLSRLVDAAPPLERCPKCHKVRLDNKPSSRDVRPAAALQSSRKSRQRSGGNSRRSVRFRAVADDSANVDSAAARSRSARTLPREPTEAAAAVRSTFSSLVPSRRSTIGRVPCNGDTRQGQGRGRQMPASKGTVVVTASNGDARHDVNNNSYYYDDGETGGNDTWPPTRKSSSGGDRDPVDVGRSSGDCLLYTSPSPRDRQKSRMPSSA